MKLSRLALLVFLCLLPLSCGVYKFNGASINYNIIKTLSIANFVNSVGSGPPNMSQTFTEGLKEYFQNNTKLELVQSQGDLQFEGEISSYSVRPQAISSSGNNNQADGTSLMRVQIAVSVLFTNVRNEEDNFERRFSFYADYDPSTTTLNAIEDDLVSEIFDALYFDIFQASVAQW